jgi:hypothetical protein
MKALKSELAKRVLADPRARSLLRDANSSGHWIARDTSGDVTSQTGPTIVVHDPSSGRVIHRVIPTVVPKAA